MYRVPNDMNHPQFLESLSTNLITFKNRKYQQLINTSAVSVSSEKKN